MVLCPRIGIDVKKHLRSLQKELFRKTIHICTAFVPLFLYYFKTLTIILLAAAGILYSLFEVLRIKGVYVPVISAVTEAAARKRDENRFVLGPVTLVSGCLICSLLWDDIFAATGILALAFGDGLASLAGKTFGRVEVPLTGGKTAAGSLTCFTAIFISSFALLHNTALSFIAALTGTLIEGLPLKDFDNLCIPVVLGGLSQFLFPHV
jgi:dolichol kinase